MAAHGAEARLPLDGVMVDERRQVVRHAFLGRSIAGGGEQLVDRGVELIGLDQAGLGLGDDVGLAAHAQDLEAHGDPGDAGAQLMGGVGGEVTFVGEHRVDPVRTGLECAADVVDLGDVGLGDRLPAEVTVADPGGARRQPLEWPGELMGLHRGQAGRCQDPTEGQYEQDVELAAKLLVERVPVGAHPHPRAVDGDPGGADAGRLDALERAW